MISRNKNQTPQATPMQVIMIWVTLCRQLWKRGLDLVLPDTKYQCIRVIKTGQLMRRDITMVRIRQIAHRRQVNFKVYTIGRQPWTLATNPFLLKDQVLWESLKLNICANKRTLHSLTIQIYITTSSKVSMMKKYPCLRLSRPSSATQKCKTLPSPDPREALYPSSQLVINSRKMEGKSDVDRSR